MKRIFGFFMIAFVAMSFASCSKVEAGYVGIKVDMLGSSKGVNDEILGPGRYFVGPNTEIFTFPTYQVNYTYTASEDEGSPTNEQFVFQTVEGMECSADLGVSMHFEEQSIAKMFQTYRKGVDEIRAVVVRNAIRDALNKVSSNMPVESVYGEGKAKMIDTVKIIVKNQLKNTGIYIDNLYLIGSVRIPTSVQQALNDKVQMTQLAQKAENERRKAEAEAAIKVAKAKGDAESLLTVARAEAEANRLKQSTLNGLLIQQQWIEKWDGGLPTYMMGSGQGVMLNLK